MNSGSNNLATILVKSIKDIRKNKTGNQFILVHERSVIKTKDRKS